MIYCTSYIYLVIKTLLVEKLDVVNKTLTFPFSGSSALDNRKLTAVFIIYELWKFVQTMSLFIRMSDRTVEVCLRNDSFIYESYKACEL